MPARIIWLSLGLLALAFAVVGILLPLVPTTPFLLVAAFAFARSSPQLHDWLVDHPRLGPPIRDWNANGAISSRAKRAAIALMLLMLALSWAVGVSGTVLAIQAVVLTLVGAFLMTRPDADRDSI